MNPSLDARGRSVFRRARQALRTRAPLWLLALLAALSFGTGVRAQTLLADAPLFATINVPGNLVLALSVEFPTAVTAAEFSGAYSTIKTYLGYFDSRKCYTYRAGTDAKGSYFAPDGLADPSAGCSGKWSGNFMNWATMHAIDPFRSALTGGYRDYEDATTTILQKALAPRNNQGTNGSNFPNKSITSSVSSVTPFSASGFYMHVIRCGNSMAFSQSPITPSDDCPSATAWNGTVAGTNPNVVYSVQVRVQVCVPIVNAVTGDVTNLETNCVKYGNNYKPEGLIQQYASKIRYSAFGYLNDPNPNGGSMLRDGGVMRARMKYVGPTQPVPGSTSIANVANANTGQTTSAEWNANDGTFVRNPDAQDATNSSESGSTVQSSGVINYLNQFGNSAQAYKYYDPVSELYYAATRYLRNKGNVPEYSDLSVFNGGVSTLAQRTAMKDGFPVITDWTDPIQYSCQKNYVLGIGDTNTNQDKDLPGNTTWRTNEPTKMPDAVKNDSIDVVAATNKVGTLEGDMGNAIGQTNQYQGNNNSAYIAGMAYLFHTTDIRPDITGTQTISTFWLDVLEGSDYKSGPSGRNTFYLATKYGGFTVPKDYSFATNTSKLPQSQWSTNGDTIPIPAAGGARPDNFFVANQADKMVAGLSTAFSRIAAGSGATTTSFSVPLPQVTSQNNSSFSSFYDPEFWTGEVTGSSISFTDANGALLDQPATTTRWTFSKQLATQIADTGWDDNRRIVTWNGAAGVRFRTASPTSPTGTFLSATDLSSLDPSYTSTADSTDYVKYLRGDKTNEVASTSTNSTHLYRNRQTAVGDIVGSKAQPAGPPSFPFSDANNPGYSAFRSRWATRLTMIYVGANDGMMHAINGALVTAQPSPAPNPPLEQDPDAGNEMFAYVPRALLKGPSSPAKPSVDGLASLGNPSFVHHYMVNATPKVYDIDFNNTDGIRTSGDWRSVLIGGLGKGGRSYYAMDVTDPKGMKNAGEETVASKVLWEFTDPSLGFTYGDPIVAKTKKYGWVVVIPSGYNNADGKGYFIFLNPRTGQVLDRVSTGEGSVSNDAGLAQINGFVVDATDGTMDAIYGGDLLGNLWRLDVTALTGATYQVTGNPLKLAVLRDASNNPQPVTSRPVIEVHPKTKVRFVMVGTGRLLDNSDIVSSRGQTFYSIADGTNATFNTSMTAPLAYPITRAMLLQSNDANALLGANAVVYNPVTQTGWYQDLGTDAATGNAYRVTTDATTLSGSVSFAATLANGDACAPSGSSRIYARDYSTSASTLTTVVNNATSLLNYSTIAGNATDLRYLSVGGTATLIAGSDTGTVSRLSITPAVPLLQRRTNWRELPTVD